MKMSTFIRLAERYSFGAMNITVKKHSPDTMLNTTHALPAKIRRTPAMLIPGITVRIDSAITGVMLLSCSRAQCSWRMPGVAYAAELECP